MKMKLGEYIALIFCILASGICACAIMELMKNHNNHWILVLIIFVPCISLSATLIALLIDGDL